MKLRRVEICEVKSGRAFAEFCHQELGTSTPASVYPAMFKLYNTIHEGAPDFTWRSAASIVVWMKERRKNLQQAYRPRTATAVLACYREAWENGILPELGFVTPEKELDQFIAEALQIEENPDWRYRLVNANGYQNRKAVFNEWKQFKKVG